VVVYLAAAEKPILHADSAATFIFSGGFVEETKSLSVNNETLTKDD
jgi:hypothetical protein